MLLKSCSIKWFGTKFIFLVTCIIYATPLTQEDYEPYLAGANLNGNALLSPDSSLKPSENESEEPIIEKPCGIWGMFKETGNSSDFKMYREIHKNGQFKRLCWAELLIIIEDNATKNKTLSREYSIILENPGDTPEEETDKRVDQYEIWDEVTKESKVLNFTTIHEEKNFTIKEHKMMFCGTGPVLTKLYFEWPKLNKTKIEIRLSPVTTTTWKLHDENRVLTEPSYNTFDTTKTNEYPAIATAEMTTENVLKITQNPFLKANANSENKFKINSDKSTALLYESGERFDPINRETVNSSKDDKNRNEDNSSKHFAEDGESLKQNPKLEADKQTSQKKSVTYDNLQKNSYLLDFLLPNKIPLNLLDGSNHKILSKVNIHLEHRTIDNATNHEKVDSTIDIDGSNIYNIILKEF